MHACMLYISTVKSRRRRGRHEYLSHVRGRERDCFINIAFKKRTHSLLVGPTVSFTNFVTNLMITMTPDGDMVREVFDVTGFICGLFIHVYVYVYARVHVRLFWSCLYRVGIGSSGWG